MQRIGTDRKLIFKEITFILVFFLLLTADQITKTYLRNAYLNNGWRSTTVIDGFFYFSYAFNTGAAWSFLADVAWGQIFFKVLTSIALVLFFFFYLYALKKRSTFLRIAILLIICGTIGNFIDRLAYGGVVDFLSFHFGSYIFPTFNFADSYLCIGAVMLFVFYLFIDESAVFKKHDKNTKVSNK